MGRGPLDRTGSSGGAMERCPNQRAWSVTSAGASPRPPGSASSWSARASRSPPADTSRRAPAAPPPLRLEHPHPKWLVPGAAFRVTGWAGAEATVQLLAGGREVGRARSGRMGRFVIEARAPQRAAAYRLALVSAERKRHLQTLVVRPLVLAAVGDVNLGRQDRARDLRRRPLRIRRAACASCSARRISPSPTSSAPSPPAERRCPGKEYTFRGSPDALPAVAQAGIDVLSLANNHSLDFGREALLDTVRHVRRSGIATVGGGRDLAAARRPARFELGGLRIAVLAYSDVRPYGFDAGPGLPGAAPASRS